MRLSRIVSVYLVTAGALVLCLSANAVFGAVIVLDDDGDRDFAAGPNVTTNGFSTNHDNGGWGAGPQYFNQTNAYNGDGADFNGGTPGPASATYTFDAGLGLAAGETYDVFAYWPAQGNTGPATYDVSDGLGAVIVDQTVATTPGISIADPFVGDSKDFQLLGQVVEDGDGIITITLSSDGSNFALADAVAVNLIPEPSSFVLCGFAIMGLVVWRRRS